MNEIVFVKHTLSTVIVTINIGDMNPYNIFESISIGNISSEIKIHAKYYKKRDGSFEFHGYYPHRLRGLNNTFTFYCSFRKRHFKMRWFHSKSNKLHIASGLTQEESYEVANKFIIYASVSKIKEENILANGIASAKLGINLFELAKQLKETEMSFVFTPDRHAALKLYTEFGTACIFSTGKILYMGSKSTDTLKKLHKYITNMGCNWKGVPL